MTRLLFPAYAMGTDWKRRHNEGVMAPRDPGERRIVAQTEALRETIETLANEDDRVDPHALEHIVSPLADALSETLNYDRGRIDGGKVSEWLHDAVAAAGWDMDTDTHITVEQV